ncbi:hypothetical protein, partial [Enterobacter sp.]|uniref:hypothetical protein n=1 Tax=Enterobacter sp. TaxID=42895 RepID=UPI0028ACA49F
ISYLEIQLLSGVSGGYINLDHDVASSICDFIYGDVNAETIYDTYTNIDILIVLTLATVIYRLTTLLLKKIRK